jgi:myo-inositol-1(or 4)-monophosphatase
MDDADLMATLDRTVNAITSALSLVEDWSPQTGATTHQQYALDLTADGPAVEVLTGAGLGVLSEESGLHHADREITVVMDPVDGSTNASRQVPWYATSLCAVDRDGPRAALVVNLATGERFEAVRGRGATKSIVALCGHPQAKGPWAQTRVMGAAALDLASVANGRFDAYLDNTVGILGPWDYLGGVLLVTEAGGVVADVQGRDLVTLEHGAKRGVVAAADPSTLDALVEFHRSARG